MSDSFFAQFAFGSKAKPTERKLEVKRPREEAVEAVEAEPTQPHKDEQSDKASTGVQQHTQTSEETAAGPPISVLARHSTAGLHVPLFVLSSHLSPHSLLPAFSSPFCFHCLLLCLVG